MPSFKSPTPAHLPAELFGGEMYRLVVESVKDYAIFHLDPTGHVASWTQGARLIKGYEAGEIIGKHFSTFYTPEDRASHKPEMELREAVRQGRFEDEGWRVRKDGSRFWANVVISPVRLEDGTLIGFAKVTRDLTVRKQQEEAQRRFEAERAAREATERSLERVVGLQQVTAEYAGAVTREDVARAAVRHLSGAFGSSGAAIYVHSDDGRTLELMDAEGCGDHLRDEVPRFEAADALPVPNVARTGRSAFLTSRDQLVAEFRGHTGAILPHDVNAAAMLALRVRGRSVGVMVIAFHAERDFDPDLRAFLDVYAQHTAQALDRARLYKEAQEAIRVRDDFLAVASHELRTPLTSLELVIGSLLRGVHDPPPLVTRRLEVVRRQSARLKDLVLDLLDVGRISGGKLVLAPARFDLSALVHEVVDRFREAASQVSTPIHVHTAPELWGCWDRGRLDQVISNLMENALKYGDQKPVEVKLFQEGDRAVLFVRDEGIGIAAEDHPRIFERFERAASSRHYAGLGLGLWISRQIVLDHGGDIQMESAPGQGATFRVELPLDAGHQDAGGAGSPGG